MNNYISCFNTFFGSYNMYKTYIFIFDNEDLYKLVNSNYYDEENNLRNQIAKTFIFLHVWYINNNKTLNVNFETYIDFFNHAFSIIFEFEKNLEDLNFAKKIFQNLKNSYHLLGPFKDSFSNKIYKTKDIINILFSLYFVYINVR